MGARRRAPLPPLATVGAALAVALVAVPLAALVIRAPGARLWAELDGRKLSRYHASVKVA